MTSKTRRKKSENNEMKWSKKFSLQRVDSEFKQMAERFRIIQLIDYKRWLLKTTASFVRILSDRDDDCSSACCVSQSTQRKTFSVKSFTQRNFHVNKNTFLSFCSPRVGKFIEWNIVHLLSKQVSVVLAVNSFRSVLTTLARNWNFGQRRFIYHRIEWKVLKQR